MSENFGKLEMAVAMFSKSEAMKTFLSIIDSYNEIMDFIFPPNLSIFYYEFRVGAWDMFLSQFKVLHWCSPASSVGTDGWKIWL
jgi:hypothetical protein